MKMVKSLLLGSAAGVFAVAGAQAADLPVKAKAVEYVKVCSLYGAGFYYIPGTDTCIKMGGYIRTEWLHNANGSFAPYANGAQAFYNRNTDTLRNRSRGIISWDVRSQTEYGTLRAYLRAGWQWTSQDPTVGGSAGTVYLDRAFIQFAGFTFGKTQSYFDFYCTACYSLQTNLLNVDTGGSGTPVFAYTAQFGNGLSATLSIEDYTEQRLPVVNLSAGAAGTAFQTTLSTTPGTVTTGAGTDLITTFAGSAFVIGTSNTGSNHGYEVPDIVGNIRVDQAWGSAQVMGALHLNQANYYGTTSQVEANGHPGEEWGWAVGAGITLKMPWDAKDTLSGAVSYAEGASRYALNPSGTLGSGNMFNIIKQGTIANAWADDAYFCSAGGTAATNPCGTTGNSGLELPTVWSIAGGFEHYWTPTLRTSIYGAYAEYEMPNLVNANFCTSAASGGPGCLDWSAWQVGSRTIWNPVTNLDIGLDIMYMSVDGARCARTTASATSPVAAIQCQSVTVASPVSSAKATGEVSAWSGILRVQRNFWP